MRRAQHFFPVSQIGNRSFVLFHGKHALRSWISLSFVKRSVHKRSFNTLSGSLHDLVFSYYHSSGEIGIPPYLRLRIPYSVQFHLPISSSASQVVSRPAEEPS